MEKKPNLGGRPKKLRIDLTDESLKDLLTKVYAEAEDIRQRSISFYGKAIKDTRINEDIALIGKTAAEYLKMSNAATNTKLQIAKMIQEYVSKNAKEEDTNKIDGNKILTDNLKQTVKQALQEHNKIKKLNEANNDLKIEGLNDKELEKNKLKDKTDNG